jgi:hypothetical protein
VLLAQWALITNGSAVQSLLQVPQWWASLVRSTHVLPQSVVPPVQRTVHCPFEQTSPVPHLWPHTPQLLGSLGSMTQALLQLVSPAAQVVTQWPCEQT